MRERINRLARGVLNSEVPVLSVRPENLRLSVRRGEMLSAEFHADSDNGIQLKGLAYSDDIRVRVLTDSFGGVRNRIRLTVDARYLEVGDELTGQLLLVTDGGEKTIPYCFTVTDQQGSELLERLKTTEDFAKVAKTDREAALRIFAYREFWRAPFTGSGAERALSRLCKEPRCGMRHGCVSGGTRPETGRQLPRDCGSHDAAESGAERPCFFGEPGYAALAGDGRSAGGLSLDAAAPDCAGEALRCAVQLSF